MSVETPTGIPGILERILVHRRQRVEEARRRTPEAGLRNQADSRTTRSFAAAISSSGTSIAVIAELKQRSPSRGELRRNFDVHALATDFEQAGARALSVLTEEDHFGGHLGNLEIARKATRLPILRKDFIYCPYQVWEAAANGADAILLIVAMLDDVVLQELLDIAKQARLAVLCEVHDAGELERAAAVGAEIIGVNNRDLRTFKVDPQRAIDLAAAMPMGAIRVTESGLQSTEDLRRASEAGYHAALVGEQLMQAADPAAELRILMGLPSSGGDIRE